MDLTRVYVEKSGGTSPSHEPAKFKPGTSLILVSPDVPQVRSGEMIDSYFRGGRSQWLSMHEAKCLPVQSRIYPIEKLRIAIETARVSEAEPAYLLELDISRQEALAILKSDHQLLHPHIIRAIPVEALKKNLKEHFEKLPKFEADIISNPNYKSKEIPDNPGVQAAP